ncbi:MAG TPA: hypothetical protein VJ046_03055 [Candidatus Paceibacterota bacterium]|nr:hypothetical protein [Candidatus Paceibacterota bacterium]
MSKIYIIAPFLAVALFYAGNFVKFSVPAFDVEKLRSGSAAKLEEQIIPSKGVNLPIEWGDLGAQMIETGVINTEKFENLYAGRGGLDDETKKILYGVDNKDLVITRENSGFLLNVFWALGLGNKNEILEKGPMSDSKYGGAGRFASTGGWTLAEGNTMNHYSAHGFIKLTPEQQRLVEDVSKNIYRPCCNNPTHFPDCNHGMAMLEFLELMASQGVDEKEMYRAALAVNSYWFPDTYLAIAQFLQTKNFDWRKAEPKDLLGYNFSSASGYQQILSELKPVDRGSGGSCGV